ncbi:rod shape-determining protein MreD [Acinetobacter sp. MD2(2019)]|uniref:rod shape-determining protein MreD n=1 Tax=Acinetobacter sp. MD2(2019) TaxID=2605273 RepID=UPI002D1F02BA|nr:rod shape-determining protein MreD [Acinetobacter sp. MD2(2019)]MEB3753890.1 rod shape-determining protein MreD [Acinetobacter sp. MD2(2019)]
MLTANYRPKTNKDPLIAIAISIVIASILSIYPLSYDASAWRPAIMLLVVMYWTLCQPVWCGVWFAFGMGVFTDLLIDAPLGQNALIFVLLTFAARFFVRERRILTFLNLWVIAFLATVAYLLFLWVTQVMVGINYPMMRRWPPLISSALIWPILYYCLKRWRV